MPKHRLPRRATRIGACAPVIVLARTSQPSAEPTTRPGTPLVAEVHGQPVDREYPTRGARAKRSRIPKGQCEIAMKTEGNPDSPAAAPGAQRKGVRPRRCLGPIATGSPRPAFVQNVPRRARKRGKAANEGCGERSILQDGHPVARLPGFDPIDEADPGRDRRPRIAIFARPGRVPCVPSHGARRVTEEAHLVHRGRLLRCLQS